MNNVINEKTLLEEGFQLMYVSDGLRRYRKNDIEIEQTVINGWDFSLRQRIDRENSSYIRDVKTWDEVSGFDNIHRVLGIKPFN